MKKHAENEIVIKTDRDHTLDNLDLLGGSSELTKKSIYLLEDDFFQLKEIEYVPVIMKIIDEIVDNSIDEALRTNFEICNDIKITITDNEVIVEDNGRGIPTEEKNGYIPAVVCFTQARSSGNFDKNKKENSTSSIGKFGVGSFLTNVCSTEFEAITSDGKQILTLICKNNLEEFSYKVKSSDKHFTKVRFKPDLNLLKVSKIDDIYKDLLITRLTHLSVTYPLLKFTIK